MRPIDQMEMFATMRRRAKFMSCCAFCGQSALHFRDELSRKEYAISLLCQACQDEVFSAEEPIEECEE